MSGKVHPTDGAARTPAPLRGLQAAVNWMSILPVPAPTRVDRGTGQWAITWLPVVGLLHGGLMVLLAQLATWSSLGALPLAAVCVTSMALLSRGMQLDGLADTVDALGSYRPAPAARAIMAEGPVGPMGVAAVVLCLALQITSLSQLLSSAALLPVLLAPALGRVAVILACTTGFRPTSPTGFGALMVGTQRLWQPALWGAAATVVLLVSAPGWRTLLVVGALSVVVLALGCLWARHLQRRLEGLNGDMLGAISEITTTLVLLVFAAAGGL